MTWSESKSGCRRHPNNNQVPGAVCSSCLRDKLTQLCLDSTNKLTQIDHLPLQCLDASSLSAQQQPKRVSSLNSVSYRRRHNRNASELMDSFSRSSSKLGFDHDLNKSRSLAFASRSQGRDVNFNGVCGRKKNGFWSKLLKLTGKGTKDTLMHSTAIIREPRAYNHC